MTRSCSTSRRPEPATGPGLPVRCRLHPAWWPPALRIGGLAGLVLALEWGRALAERRPGWALVALLGGGAALCGLGLAASPGRLGLGLERMAQRLLCGLALAVVLLLPAAVRWSSAPALGPPWLLAAIVVSIGEELAFRGHLFAALDEVAGGPAAVGGTTVLWTAAHALSHPLAFLLPVAAAGLLLGLWRWATRDLVGPILGHVLADLAL